jgi:hypothetical protein
MEWMLCVFLFEKMKTDTKKTFRDSGPPLLSHAEGKAVSASIIAEHVLPQKATCTRPSQRTMWVVSPGPAEGAGLFCRAVAAMPLPHWIGKAPYWTTTKISFQSLISNGIYVSSFQIFWGIHHFPFLFFILRMGISALSLSTCILETHNVCDFTTS